MEYFSSFIRLFDIFLCFVCDSTLELCSSVVAAFAPPVLEFRCIQFKNADSCKRSKFFKRKTKKKYFYHSMEVTYYNTVSTLHMQYMREVIIYYVKANEHPFLIP